ncbi:MAG TPA: alpha/beta fold hydrolase [Thermoanaerobaculia bacterium]|jgi:3-oxoadipate enol-lactonase|nr:alpha/beta fold hydrolase [Thermoanaerobaculia bacterium]
MNLHHEVAGEGEPLFLLNGIMMTTATWAETTRALAPHFQCVLHDFRGQLRSEKPPGPYSMSMHVEDLAALMDRLGIESAHLVGTSYGGEVGLMFAAAHPERVRSLSVIASVAKADDALRKGALRWAALARRAPEQLWDSALPLFYSPRFIAANPAFIEAGRQRVSALPPDWFRAFADLCEAFAALDADLAAIRCPTLVVCGSGDTLKPPHRSREIAEGIAGAQLVIIEDAGHAVVVEKPEAVNEALLRFLPKPIPPTTHRS